MVRTIYKENCSIPYRIFRKKVTVPFFDRLGLTQKIQAPRKMILFTSGLLHTNHTCRGPPGKPVGNSRSDLESSKKPLIFFCYHFSRESGTHLHKEREVPAGDPLCDARTQFPTYPASFYNLGRVRTTWRSGLMV